MKNKFKAKVGAPFDDEQAQVYGADLLRLSKKKGGILQAQDVVEDAKNIKSSYHDYFEWDDSVAGEEYRRSQARVLLSHIVTVEIVGNNEEPSQIREFYNVKSGDTRGYVHRSDVFTNTDLSDQLINRALKELEAWQRRYEVYTDLQFACAEIKKVTNKIKKTQEVAAV